jgi:antirestriction protein ArdC
MPAASFPTATAGAQPTGDEATAIPFLKRFTSNTEHCENLPATDTRSIWPVNPTSPIRALLRI